MSEYQLEIKQIVDYPRCRIYRQFIQNLMADRSIRTSGGSGLFYYTVLCNYANFRTSYGADQFCCNHSGHKEKSCILLTGAVVVQHGIMFFPVTHLIFDYLSPVAGRLQ